MANKFHSNNFLRKTYVDDIFNSYIIPWNCHILYNKPQNYLYTHRYKAVLGFDFSYVMKGAQFPENENKGFAGIGFFSSYAQSSWIILDRTDGKVDIRGAARSVLPIKFTDNSRGFHYYSGVYYNLHNSIADQANNRALHYMFNVYRNIVNSDRGELPYLEQTYCNSMTPGHWDNSSLTSVAPAIFSIKPCARTDWFIDFFGKRKHWITKLNFLSTRELDFTRSIASIYGNRSPKYLLPQFWDFFRAWKKIKFARLLKFARRRATSKKEYYEYKRLISRAYMTPGFPSRYNPPAALIRVMNGLAEIDNLADYSFMNYVRSFRIFFNWYRMRRIRRRLLKRIKFNSETSEKISRMGFFFFEPHSNKALYRSCAKKGISYLSKRYSKKKRYNLRMWYLWGGSPFSHPNAAVKAIRYKKIYKKRKYIFVL